MAKKRTTTAPPCAFCNNPRNSKEHHWPQWLDELYPSRTHEDINSQMTLTVQNLISIPKFTREPNLRKRRGHTRTVSKKSVCVSCNGGWMSILQDRAKPILIELILGTKSSLTVEEQEIICQWMIMTDMTSEFTDIPTMTTTAEQRFEFKDKRTPPKGWMIFAGRYKGVDWDIRFRHHALSTELYKPFNVHTTLFGVGEFLFYVMAVHEGVFKPIDEFMADFASSYNLERMWPPKNEIIAWDRLPYFSDSDAADLADFIHIMIKPLYIPGMLSGIYY